MTKTKIKKSKAELKEYRLGSNPGISAPGTVRWAINGYKFPKDRKVVLAVVMAWPIPKAAAIKLLTEEVPYKVTEDEVVVFTA